MYDVLMVGLGPAGSTLARNLSTKYKICALDLKGLSVNGGFQKPCGGLLSPDAQKTLAAQNLALPLSILVNPQIFAVNTIDLNINYSRVYQRFYINTNRHKFDLWLMSLISSKVDIFLQSKCIKIQKIDNYFKVIFKQNNQFF